MLLNLFVRQRPQVNREFIECPDKLPVVSELSQLPHHQLIELIIALPSSGNRPFQLTVDVES